MSEQKESDVKLLGITNSNGIPFATPLDAFKNGEQEKVMYVTCTRSFQDDKERQPDFVAMVDVDPNSAAYGQVISTVDLAVDDEVHHSGWNACASCHGKQMTRRYLIVPSFGSGNVYAVDVADAKAPVKIAYKAEGKAIKEKYGLSWPHTTHCLANGQIMVSYLGADDNSNGIDFILFDEKLNVVDTWIAKGIKREDKPKYNYDFWYQPYLNVMVTSEWGNPNAFSKGFDLKDVESGQYGSSIHVWDWTKKEIIQSFKFDNVIMALEVRFMHNPKSSHCFFNGCLTSNIVHLWQDDKSKKWEANSNYIQVEGVDMENWALPNMPGLITDIIVSMDDKYLYFANWLHGDVRQYDITDPFNPKMTGQVFVGGSLREDSGFKIKGDAVKAPSVPKIKDVRLQGGPQMLQLSLDGKRLYVTNSLFSPFDKQFYPDLMSEGGQIILIDVDHEKGGMALNMKFLTDFGKNTKFGPARPHEMRYPNGDCTSDIFLVQDN